MCSGTFYIVDLWHLEFGAYAQNEGGKWLKMGPEFCLIRLILSHWVAKLVLETYEYLCVCKRDFKNLHFLQNRRRFYENLG